MQQCVAEGNVIGWGLVDLVGGGDPTLGVQFEGTSGMAFGGVSATAAGSFTGTVAAGTYLLLMAADNGAPGGAFSYSATFAPVPGPGVMAMLAVAGLCASRRRRRDAFLTAD
jgi:MYXO-CTERM domain-containing protein